MMWAPQHQFFVLSRRHVPQGPKTIQEVHVRPSKAAERPPLRSPTARCMATYQPDVRLDYRSECSAISHAPTQPTKFVTTANPSTRVHLGTLSDRAMSTPIREQDAAPVRNYEAANLECRTIYAGTVGRVSFNTTPTLPCQQRPCNPSTVYPERSRRKHTPTLSTLRPHGSSTAPSAALPRTRCPHRPSWHVSPLGRPYVCRSGRQRT
ncbi:hypothetical protein PENSPDRAFT_618024 [Peniophora sp. CONT]|nr:hypothetical protein PENSPDRAFT_618024 [Peniophora sp. CONT]